MVRLLEGKKKDPEKIRETLQKGYGAKHPETIMGYAGFFYETGDVYASDAIFRRISCLPEFRDFVMDAIKRFEAGDFGDISESDLDENTENRWLFGVPRLFGRYGYKPHASGEGGTIYREIIRIRQWGEHTYILFDSELDTETGLQNTQT